MSNEPADQPTFTVALINGVHTALTAHNVIAVSPASSVYTFTANYSFVTAPHQITTYKKGFTYTLSPAIKALLLAASAPMIVTV